MSANTPIGTSITKNDTIMMSVAIIALRHPLLIKKAMLGFAITYKATDPRKEVKNSFNPNSNINPVAIRKNRKKLFLNWCSCCCSVFIHKKAAFAALDISFQLGYPLIVWFCFRYYPLYFVLPLVGYLMH